MQSITPEYLATMKAGQIFETEGFFQGVDPEPCVWTLRSSSNIPTPMPEYTFDVTYMRIAVGAYKLKVRKNKVEMVETA